MLEKLVVSIILPVSPEQLYQAWLDSQSHSDFTSAQAVIDPIVGGEFTAWDGYITGKTLELEPFRRILQSWRTTDFQESDSDSSLEILFEPVDERTRLILNHSNIPEGEAESYRQGWEDYYFKPMIEYFTQD